MEMQESILLHLGSGSENSAFLLSTRGGNVNPSKIIWRDPHDHSGTPGLGGRVREEKSYCFLFSIFLGDQKTKVGSEDPLFADNLLCAHAHVKTFIMLLDFEILLLLLLILFMIILIKINQ